MNFYTVDARSNFIDFPRVRSFHSNMFHGLAERDGEEYPHDADIYAYTEAPSYLQISRTGLHVPEIFKPSSDFVVSAQVADQLRFVPHIRLHPVEFKKLVNVDYAAGDQGWFEKWGGGDPRDLLRSLPDIEEFHQTIGEYFEIHTWRHQDIVDRYPEAREVTVEEGTPPMPDETTLKLSERMLADFPMFWFGDTLMTPEVFAIFDSHLDRDYFIIRKYVIE